MKSAWRSGLLSRIEATSNVNVGTYAASAVVAGAAVGAWLVWAIAVGTTKTNHVAARSRRVLRTMH
jgi:hypothetical protein